MSKKPKEYDGIPGLDELALKLSVKEEEQPYTGLVLFGKSGKAYSLVPVLWNSMDLIITGVNYMIKQLAEFNGNIAGIEERITKLEGGKPKNEPNKGAGQPKKTNNPEGNTEIDKS